MAVMRRHPAVDPLPWRRLTPLLVVSAAYLAVAATSWPARRPRRAQW